MFINLDNLLKEKGMNRFQLARLTGITYACICNLCKNDSSRIYLDSIEKICKVLECTPNDLFIMNK